MERHTYRVTVTLTIDTDEDGREYDRERLQDMFEGALDSARRDNPDIEAWWAKDEPGPVIVRDCKEDES